ncbi:MAG: cytochrome b/b6 domain-containing protein [Candidatus Marinimicrobia bacterium]|nr:cytochrome b/b6 domain-containing protein [Candidatus Neomarinimicrobiota bacterium]
MSSETPKRYIRFQKPVVIQHYILMLSVLGLMFSGYMLYSIKSAETGFDPISYFSYSLWEQIHIWFGILLGLTILWHFLYILFTLYGHSDFLHILPNKNDLKSLIGLGFKRSMIKKERFGLQEKLTYWIIGAYLILMVITGLLQYANVYTVNYISRTLYIYIDGFHGMYGLLMGIILTVWHLYSIFLKPGRFPGTLSWWDGKISSEEMNRYQEARGEISDESDTGKESPS